MVCADAYCFPTSPPVESSTLRETLRPANAAFTAAYDLARGASSVNGTVTSSIGNLLRHPPKAIMARLGCAATELARQQTANNNRRMSYLLGEGAVGYRL